jgi:hypothetical protein
MRTPRLPSCRRLQQSANVSRTRRLLGESRRVQVVSEQIRRASDRAAVMLAEVDAYVLDQEAASEQRGAEAVPTGSGEPGTIWSAASLAAHRIGQRVVYKVRWGSHRLLRSVMSLPKQYRDLKDLDVAAARDREVLHAMRQSLLATRCGQGAVSAASSRLSEDSPAAQDAASRVRAVAG